MTATVVYWPAEARPERATIYAVNEGWTSAAPDVVWAWLLRARDWPNWYDNCKNLAIEQASGPDLFHGCKFRWTTFGVRVATRVEEFEPPTRLAWSGTAPGSAGYHAWVLEPRDGGTRIVTEETQRGLIPFVGQLYLRPAIHRQHQKWVDELARRAAGGRPA